MFADWSGSASIAWLLHYRYRRGSDCGSTREREERTVWFSKTMEGSLQLDVSLSKERGGNLQCLPVTSRPRETACSTALGRSFLWVIPNRPDHVAKSRTGQVSDQCRAECCPKTSGPEDEGAAKTKLGQARAPERIDCSPETIFLWRSGWIFSFFIIIRIHRLFPLLSFSRFSSHELSPGRPLAPSATTSER